MTETSDGALEVGFLDDLGKWQNALVSASNIDLETTPGKVAILGSPVWNNRYDPYVFPENDTPPWTRVAFNIQRSVSGGVLRSSALSLSQNGFDTFKRENILDSTKDVFVTMRVKCPFLSSLQNADSFFFNVYNGSKGVVVFGSRLGALGIINTGSTPIASTFTCPQDTFFTISLLLKSNGVVKLWADGVLVLTSTAGTTALNSVRWGFGFTNFADSAFTTQGAVDFAYFHYHTDFKGDQLSSQDLRVSPITMPDTLPASGQIIVLNDFTRAPDVLKTVFWKENQALPQIALCGVTAASTIVQLDAAADMARFAAGNVVDIRVNSTSKLITDGSQRTIASVDTINKRITLTGAVVTTDATMSVYPFAGTMAVSSWTSTSTDFSSGNDPAGFVSVANGAIPTSQVKRAQRLKVIMTPTAAAVGPELDALTAGMLWTSAPLFIGSAIAGWRTLLATLTTPSGTTQAMQIRRTAVLTAPLEADWGPWINIVSGNNIGTILADGAPPTSRQVQLKVEQGVSSVDLEPFAEALIVQWNEGSNALLPLVGILHKKRYLFCAAQSASLTNDRVIVVDRNDAFMKYVGWNLNALIHFGTLLIGFSSLDAKILSLDVAGLYNDQGAAIDAFIDSAEEFFADLEIRKNIRYGFLHVGSSVWNLTTSYKRQGDADFTGAAAFALDGTGREVRQNYPFGTVTRALQRRYRCNTVDQSMDLTGETVYFDRRGTQP
jgi:hypothetical protein